MGFYRNSRTAIYQSNLIPNKPTGLSASANGDVALSWIDTNTTKSVFSIERSLNGSTGWAEITTVTNGLSHTDTGLDASTQYFYRVAALNGQKQSNYSIVANTTTSAGAAPFAGALVGPGGGLIGPGGGLVGPN